MAMAMAAVDDHGQYLVLPRLDQLLIRIGASTSSIRMSAFLPSSMLPNNPCQPSILAGVEVTIRTSSSALKRLPCRATDQPGSLQLTQQVLAAARRPVATQGDCHAGRLCSSHIGRFSVEQQIGQWRRRRTGGSLQLLKVIRRQGGAVNGDEVENTGGRGAAGWRRYPSPR